MKPQIVETLKEKLDESSELGVRFAAMPERRFLNAMPERRFLKYRLTVSDEKGEIIREMQMLKPQEGTSVQEKVETLKVLMDFFDRVKKQPDFSSTTAVEITIL